MAIDLGKSPSGVLPEIPTVALTNYPPAPGDYLPEEPTEQLPTGHRPAPGFVRRMINSVRERLSARRQGSAELGQLALADVAVADKPVLEAPTYEGVRDLARAQMQEVAARYAYEVAASDIAVPVDERVRVSVRPAEAGEVPLPDGWTPRSVSIYSTHDPWQTANPGLVGAVRGLIEGTTKVIKQVDGDVEAMRALGMTVKPGLTYATSNRNAGGKRPTVITEELCKIDPSLCQWINILPNAEGLYPVVHPNGGTYIRDPQTGEIINRPSSPALMALTAGADNGRAVREREAIAVDYLSYYLARVLDRRAIADGELRLTDLGSGTGDPGMRTALAMLPQLGPNGRVVVNGYDNSESSLAVATRMAQRLSRDHPNGGKLEFRDRFLHILTPDGLRQAVAESGAHIYQSMGVTEYTASENASSRQEQQQYEIMRRMGMVSTEDFYRIVYEAMPEGSVWITGNMQPNPELPFVERGLGWGSICARTLEEMTSIQRSDIPGEAVDMIVPDPKNSAGIYNLFAIRKLSAHSR